MRSFSLLLVVLAAILVAFMTKPSQSQQIIMAACTTTVGTYNYNLTGLAQQYLTQDATTVDKDNNVYYYRPCQVLLNQQCAEGIANPAACQRDVRRPPQYHNCGTVPSASFKQRATAGADQGFLLTFTGGSEDRQLDIEFVCDKGAGAGSLVAKNPAEGPTKNYHLQWASSFACPVQSGGDGGDGGGDGHGGDGKGDGKKGGDGDDGPAISGGWIFIICLVGVTILYFAVGAVVNKFVRHKEGIEIIPNVEFWMALPGLVKDGHLFVYRKLRGLCGRGGFEEV